MNKSNKKTTPVKETTRAKVEAIQSPKKTTTKKSNVTPKPKKSSVAKKTTKKATTKKPVAKKLPAKSKAVKKLIDAASPTKVSPGCSSEFTRQVEVRILPKDAKVISSTIVAETMYIVYCTFEHSNLWVTETVGVYTTIHLAKQAIQAREEYHKEHNHKVIDSNVMPILVDDISKDKPTIGVYGGVSIEYVDEAIAEERKESDEEIVTAEEMEKHIESLAEEKTCEDVEKSDTYLILGTGVMKDEDGVEQVYVITAESVTHPHNVPDRIEYAKLYYAELGYTDIRLYSYKVKNWVKNDPLQLTAIDKYPKCEQYKHCSSLKDVIVGYLTNSLYMPVK